MAFVKGFAGLFCNWEKLPDDLQVSVNRGELIKFQICHQNTKSPIITKI